MREMGERIWPGEKVFSPRTLDRQVQLFKTYSDHGYTPDGNLNVIACFQEHRDAEKCVPLPPLPKPITGETNGVFQRQSKATCEAEVEGKKVPGIHANERFRIADFNMVEGDPGTITNMNEKWSFQRKGQCIRLFGQTSMISTADTYQQIARDLGPGTGDVFKVALSGVGCVVGVGGWLEGVKAGTTTASPLANTVASLGLNQAKAAQLVANGADRVSRIRKALNTAGTIPAVLGDMLIRIGRLDNAILSLGEFALKAGGIGSKASRMAGMLLGKNLQAALKSIGGAGGAAGIMALKLTPRASLAVQQLSAEREQDQQEATEQSYAANVENTMTLEEAAAAFEGLSAAHPEEAAEVERITNSQLFKQSQKSLEQLGIGAGDIAYYTLLAGSFFVPFASCGLLAVDAAEYARKDFKKDNISDLGLAITGSANSALKRIAEIGNPRFGEIKTYFDDLTLTTGAAVLANKTEEATNAAAAPKAAPRPGQRPVVRDRDTKFDKVIEYYRTLNFYTAYEFNANPQGTYWNTTGTLSGLEDMVEAQGKAEGDLDAATKVLYASQAMAIEMLDQAEEIAKDIEASKQDPAIGNSIKDGLKEAANIVAGYLNEKQK
jgi:hypothetical protein